MLQHIYPLTCIVNYVNFYYNSQEERVYMRVKIDNVLQDRNKSRYWLSQQLGCNYQSLVKLCSGETSSISFDLMTRICEALNCEPNDIFDIKN